VKKKIAEHKADYLGQVFPTALRRLLIRRMSSSRNADEKK
jgi:hypothetical protein